VLTRIAIADHVSEAFDRTPVSRLALLAHAEARQAPQEVLEALSSLPDAQYRTMSQLWQHLPDLPVEA
jgi:hypothetical protein